MYFRVYPTPSLRYPPVSHAAGKTAVHSRLHACSLVSGVPDARARPDVSDELTRYRMQGSSLRLPRGALSLSCVRYTGKRDCGISGHHITGASPDDDIQAEDTQDIFLQWLRIMGAFVPFCASMHVRDAYPT